MSKKKQALGRGLSAILTENPARERREFISEDATPEEKVSGVAEIKIESIKTNPFQPRTNFNEEALQELALSISQLGIVQPLTLRHTGDGTYQIISGERRFRASQIAGLKTVPAYLREANDTEMLEMALVENIQRENLDPIEIAISYQRLMEEFNHTQEQLSDRVGKKRSTVANYLRLLKLEPIIQYGLRDKMITMGHARALLSIENETDQLEVYEKIIRQGISVRQVEEIGKKLKEPKIDKTKVIEEPHTEQYAELKSIRQSIVSNTGLKVDIQYKKNKGKLIFSFDSEQDLEKLKTFLTQ